MGTRHMQMVITKDNQTKVRQYGQWDGYPSGQGVEILKYLKEGNLQKYQENLENLRQIKEEEYDIVNASKDWKKEYPYLSRDCGSDIHQLIEDGKVKFVQFIEEEEANKWCEGFYTIDFYSNTFMSEFHGIEKIYSLDDLPTEEEYLKLMEPEED